ncbi:MULTISPECIES: ATP-dependent Clp protease proteolytic subunit [unclassified Bradyrhizobium]|uniref:ATP-dependent Clp protease proteolytic subunit n=1 Tax=unclassified Bradyrhizobium TaxID=2631580 RepID=UPI00247A53AD|nr:MULTISPECIES: ATP-dependent Clp protease proteolytic subunit [unclassified Bradyrhizobium]WGS18939.1 ATP-dependent Clp protease proteolytic subunit [Bradyrhizobium sp. ISRA463]WGS25772.1 ATP-dependent Clp protease proteolytic subunit [Bradyrhizobium sp. ISRA464]
MSEIYCVRATPRSVPMPLPVFPNPTDRPEGVGPSLVLEFHSPVPAGEDVAAGKMPRRDTLAYLQAIRGAGNRSIECRIDCAGGREDDALPIALALLQHPFRVSARIVGRCSSAAVLIALAADRRSIVPHGTVLIHRAARIYVREQWDAIQQMPEADKDVINESLLASDDKVAALLTARLGISEEVARSWMREGRKWGADETLSRGFADSIADEEIAQ